MKDIVPGSGSSNPQSFTRVPSGAVFTFSANGENGAVVNQLWFTDGTSGGTGFVKQIAPAASTLSDFHAAADGANFIVIPQSSGSYANQIWKTDGTANGTAVAYQSAN